MEPSAKAPLSPGEKSALQRVAGADEGPWLMLPRLRVRRLQQCSPGSKQVYRMVLAAGRKVGALASLNRMRASNSYDHMGFHSVG
jgi:hypothetical protein